MSEMVNAILQIELRSDLCAGSGYSYAGVIDSDVCYDEYGLPYIPAKRIRGCLRGTLEECLYSLYTSEQVKGLFGEAGSKSASNLVVGNARIKGYQQLVDDLKNLRARKNGAKFYGTQEILGRFTNVIGQTKIQENGTAKDNTLRYTRVVNRISPLSNLGDSLVFEAKIAFPACQEQKFEEGEESSSAVDYREMLENAALATRHIGLKRNRGFGNVKCSLVENRETRKEEETGNTKDGSEAFLDQPQSSGRKRITFRVRNVDPLMLSATTENESVTYISGQSMLGLLAGRYLKESGHSAEDEMFKDLFLNGQTIYSNFYPADEKRIFYPAPVYINKLKLTEKYVIVLKAKLPEKSEIENEDYMIKPGNQPKKLKGKYVSFGNGKIAVREVECDVVYHHSHSKKDADGDEGILYGMEVIRPNQVFEGFIETTGDENAKELKNLLEEGDLYFGKSKSSQYGRCVLENIPEKEFETGNGDRRMSAKAGQHLVVTFLSDAIFLSDRGEYTVYRDEVERIVADQLDMGDKISPESEKAPEYLSNILTTLSTGYRSVWNLRRAAVPAIKAGSCIVYHLSKDCEIAGDFIGERNLEGYGQIRIDVAEEMPYQLKEIGKAEPVEDSHSNDVKVSSGARNLLEKLLVDRWMDELVGDYLRTGNGRIQISNTALGRITLMVRESLEGPVGQEKSLYQNQLSDLCERIASIKTASVRREGEKILSLVAVQKETNASAKERNWVVNLSETTRKVQGKPAVSDGAKERIQEIKEELLVLESADGSSRASAEQHIDEMINERWGEYLTMVLTEQKYMHGR